MIENNYIQLILKNPQISKGIFYRLVKKVHKTVNCLMKKDIRRIEFCTRKIKELGAVHLT